MSNLKLLSFLQSKATEAQIKILFGSQRSESPNLFKLTHFMKKKNKINKRKKI